MTDKLRSCPFCGSTDQVIRSLKGGMNIPKYGWKIMHFVECENCGAVTSFRANEDRESTIAMYNGAESVTEKEAKRRQEGIERWQNVPKNMR